jgi:hypothetical protein
VGFGSKHTTPIDAALFLREVLALHDEWFILLQGLICCLALGELLELGTPVDVMADRQHSMPGSAAEKSLTIHLLDHMVQLSAATAVATAPTAAAAAAAAAGCCC